MVFTTLFISEDLEMLTRLLEQSRQRVEAEEQIPMFSEFLIGNAYSFRSLRMSRAINRMRYSFYTEISENVKLRKTATQ